MRRYANAVLAVCPCLSLCLSVCLSVTSRRSIKTVKETELVFGLDATLCLSYNLAGN